MIQSLTVNFDFTVCNTRCKYGVSFCFSLSQSLSHYCIFSLFHPSFHFTLSYSNPFLFLSSLSLLDLTSSYQCTYCRKLSLEWPWSTCSGVFSRIFQQLWIFLINCQVVLEWTTCLTDRQAKNMCFISSLTVLMNKLFVSDYCVFPLYTGLTVAIVASGTGAANQ